MSIRWSRWRLRFSAINVIGSVVPGILVEVTAATAAVDERNEGAMISAVDSGGASLSCLFDPPVVIVAAATALFCFFSFFSFFFFRFIFLLFFASLSASIVSLAECARRLPCRGVRCVSLWRRRRKLIPS